MGYECPVCATPQADARHLANHMAFTAVLGDSEHEAWLDEHAPGWSETGEDELAPRVAEHAPESEFDQVFEDTAGGLEESDPTDPLEERSGALFDDGPGHVRERGPRHESHGHDHGHGRGSPNESEELDEETREVLEEAREMTREMLAEEGREGRERDVESESDEADGGDAGDEGDGHDG